MSTGTIRSATSRTQLTASKNPRNHQPTAVTAANFVKFAAMSSPTSEKRTVRAASATMVPASTPGGAARQSGSASQVTEKNAGMSTRPRSEEHTSELQSQSKLVCRLLLEKKNKICQSHA